MLKQEIKRFSPGTAHTDAQLKEATWTCAVLLSRVLMYDGPAIYNRGY